MQPFFKSMYGAIIPFENVSHINAIQGTQCNITVLSGVEVSKFTFKTTEDRDSQLKAYEDYLICQFNLKEL